MIFYFDSRAAAIVFGSRQASLPIKDKLLNYYKINNFQHVHMISWRIFEPTGDKKPAVNIVGLASSRTNLSPGTTFSFDKFM